MRLAATDGGLDETVLQTRTDAVRGAADDVIDKAARAYSNRQEAFVD